MAKKTRPQAAPVKEEPQPWYMDLANYRMAGVRVSMESVNHLVAEQVGGKPVKVEWTRRLNTWQAKVECHVTITEGTLIGRKVLMHSETVTADKKGDALVDLWEGISMLVNRAASADREMAYTVLETMFNKSS